MGYELDSMDTADRELADGLAGIFSEMVEDMPQGEVVEVDETGPDFVRLCLRDDEGIDSTWLISFAVGKPFEFTRIG
jgi:hypothetical protein